MFASFAASRSSKAKGWILIALTVAVLAATFVLFDLGSQFKLRQAAQQLAVATLQNLTHRPQPRPIYPQASRDAPTAKQ